MNNMELNELSLIAYMVLDPSWRCPLSDFYMNGVNNGNGKAFLLFDNGEPVSYAILESESGGYTIKYIFTDEKKRRQGYANALMEKLVADNKGIFHIHLVHTLPFYKALSTCALNNGFHVLDTSVVYSIAVNEDFFNRMDEMKFHRMKEFILRSNGMTCVRLCDASEDIIKQLRESITTDFNNSLNPSSFIDRTETKLDWDLSFVLHKEGELMAYTLITRLKKSMVCFEQISEAKNQLDSGIILAPLCASLEEIRIRPEIVKINMTVSDTNDKSRNLIEQIFTGMDIQKIKNESYYLLT